MAVSVRSSVTTTHSAVATWAPSGMPSGWQVDDIGVLIMGANSNIGVTTSPSGWIQLGGGPVNSSDNDVRSVVYVRRLQSGDTAPSLVWGGSQSGGSVLLAIQGVPAGFDLTTFTALNLIKTASLGSTSSGQNITVNEPDVPTGGGLELTIVAMDLSAAGSTYTQPSGFNKTITDFDSTSDVLIGVAHRVDASASSGGTLSWTSSATDAPAVWAITFPASLVVTGTYWGRWGHKLILGTPQVLDPNDLLKYAPPSTAGWTVVNIPTGSSRYTYTGTGSNNVVFNMPATVRGGVLIKNVANFVLIGGAIYINNSSASDPTQVFGAQRRGVEVQNLTGIGHLEGLEITHNTDIASQGDGFYFTTSPNGDIRIQNCRIPMIYGQFDRTTGGDHGDVIQMYNGTSGVNGLGTLRIDKMTYGTVYQGGPNVFDQSLDAIYVDRVDGYYDNALATSLVDHKGGGMMALNGPPLIVTVNNYWLREVRNNMTLNGVLDTNGAWSATNGNQPAENATYTHPSVNGGASPAFTYNSTVAEYVPSGSAGLNYTSPGYQ